MKTFIIESSLLSFIVATMIPAVANAGEVVTPKVPVPQLRIVTPKVDTGTSSPKVGGIAPQGASSQSDLEEEQEFVFQKRTQQNLTSKTGSTDSLTGIGGNGKKPGKVHTSPVNNKLPQLSSEPSGTEIEELNIDHRSLELK
jgi:hypothetical protein